MWTLKLVLSGLIFVGIHNGEYSLLALNPDYLSGSTPSHQARLTLARDHLVPDKRPIDDFDAHTVSFILRNEDLILTAASPTPVGDAPNTRNGHPKPCPSCNLPKTVSTMRPDASWANSLRGIARKITLIDPLINLDTTTALRPDVLSGPYSKDKLMFARLRVSKGTLTSYTLWGELGQPDNTDDTAIGVYCFVEPGKPCLTANAVAVAETIAITLKDVTGPVSITSKMLSTGAQLPDPILPILVQGKPGETVVVELSNERFGGHVHAGDFNVFYELLTVPANLKYFSVPKPPGAPDENGACSPVRP